MAQIINDPNGGINSGGVEPPKSKFDYSGLSQILNGTTGFSAMLSVPDVYAISGRTDGSIGSSSPIKITTRQFSDAYNEFLKQPK